MRRAGEEFFTILAANIQSDPSLSRFMLGMDLKVTTGSQEIVDFLTVAQANLGITSSGEIPNYTNLSRGRGIFASRSHFILEGLQLGNTGLDNLKNSSLTASLNFK